MPKVRLLLTVHNHQPPDNFGWIFEKAYGTSYEPFVGVLERYPDVKVALHYSGSLLEWFAANKPDFIKRLKALIRRRQVELLTGGFYDPILPMIPDRDKSAQIGLLTEYIKNYFEYVPRGVWLAERVWEPELSNVFMRHGLQYTVVDEYHLRTAGVKGTSINGYYVLGNGFKIFAADKKLRYIMPFSRIKDIVGHFTRLSAEDAEALMVFADDGEKFGFWPHTYAWVYKKKWLEQFFAFLSASSKDIETVSFDQASDLYKPRGEVTIPRTSYGEMMEWSHGDFNNFFQMYPEVNIMRNRMLGVSAMIHEAQGQKFLTSKQRGILENARVELFKAQAGCAYWHGIFGGLYLNHLRSGIYRHLIAAQNLIERLAAGPKIQVRTCDLDDDKHDEVVIGNKFIELYVKPDSKGVIFEFDLKTKTRNIMTTIARRREPYHARLLKPRTIGLLEMKRNIDSNKELNIYDVLGIKDKSLKQYLVYDDHQKNSFIDYIFSGRVGINDFAKAKFANIVPLSRSPYRLTKSVQHNAVSCILDKEERFVMGKKPFSLQIRKVIMMEEEACFNVEYTLTNLSGEFLKAVFAVEFNWSLMDRRFLRKRDVPRTNELTLEDGWERMRLTMQFSDTVRLWTVPVFTLNESEAGLEKTYQYVSVLAQKPIELDVQGSVTFNTKVQVE
ncbi:MAG: DUF1926 domain-containing protein [Candidatus Omnitrophica bacterium]|nr:DUF1926 domain-containing protein [Candidatus Omnitrophota bacterium]